MRGEDAKVDGTPGVGSRVPSSPVGVKDCEMRKGTLSGLVLRRPLGLCALAPAHRHSSFSAVAAADNVRLGARTDAL